MTFLSKRSPALTHRFFACLLCSLACLLCSLLMVAGCGSSGGAPVSGTPVTVPVLTLSSSSLTFGSVTVGSSSAAQTLTLSNTGAAALTVSNITVSDSTDYVLTNGCGSSLAPAAQCTLSLLFSPKSATSLPGTITVSTNASPATQTVTLTGTGVAAAAPAAVTLSTSTLAFGSVAAGTTSASSAVTLSNTGGSTLTIGGIALSGSNASSFSETTTCGATLAAGSSCTVSVSFSPAAGQSYSAALVFTDSAGNSPQTVALTGTGTAALAVLSSSSLTFGATPMNTTSSAQSVTLTNSGNAPLSITSIAASNSVFAVSSACGSSLAAGSSCTISVTFTPTAAQSYSASLLLTDSAAGSPQTVTLSGTGTAPVATLSTNALSFPSTTANTTSAAQTVTLSNTGTAPLTGIALTLSGSNASVFAQTSTCGATLAAGGSCSISVTFSPAAAASYAATLNVADNASGSPQTVALTGSGMAATAAQAVLSPASLTFTATNTNTTSTSQQQTVILSNPGTATLTGIGATLTGTGASNFSFTTNCGATLAVNATCNFYVTFGPSTTTGTYAAALSVSDSATGSPQTASLSGTETAPAATLSATSITFPSTTAGTTSAASSVSLTNSGSAALTITGITLGGTNAANFATTNTCGGTLAVGASCTISATFTPAAAQGYSGTITVADNAPGSPQTIALSGTGTTTAVTRTLLTFPESDNSVTPLYALVNNAASTIDMTMYELQDTTFDNDLIAACKRGVRVRVILSSSEKSNNNTAYTALNTAGTNCSAVLSNTAFTNTHQKTITVDKATTAILSLNLQSQYYSTTRDFGLVENDTADIAAIEATFNADYAAGTPYGGTQGASDFTYTPALGDDLIWSPTTAQAAMENIIKNATSTLLIENEELANSASYIVNDLVAACQRGVVVHFTIVNQSAYQANFKTLENAGCGVHVYPDTTTGFYVHAKVVVADYGLSTQSVYMGSINYSNASMNSNRELGLYISDNAAVQTLYTTLTSDYNGGTAY